MRMEELNDNNFIKGTDSVERYLLDKIKAYFNSAGLDQESSREYIINEAVKRMREELVIDNAGVLSVNGETGVISITLADLGGEPMIENKGTAFNVNFGTEAGTACMGNDTRLSDRRKPLTHVHSIEEISGLSGLISSINTKLEKTNGYVHIHDNKLVLDMITYSGVKTNVDLVILDTLEQQVQTVIDDIEQKITTLQQSVDLKMQETTDTIENYNVDVEEIYTYADAGDTALRTEMNGKVDAGINTLRNDTVPLVTNKVDVVETTPIIDILNYTFSFIGEEEVLFSSFLTAGATGAVTHTHAVSTELDTAISELNISNCQHEVYIEYTDPTTSTLLTTQPPLLRVENNALSCVVTVDIVNNKTIEIKVLPIAGGVPDFLVNAKVFYRVYGVKDVDYITR
jgi:hypothetical protein